MKLHERKVGWEVGLECWLELVSGNGRTIRKPEKILTLSNAYSLPFLETAAVTVDVPVN